MEISEARIRWASAQGLGRRREEPLEQTLVRTGWIRTLGGAAAYLGLSARNLRADVAWIDTAISQGKLCVAPAARGCMYLVPETHLPLALRIANHLSAKRTRRDREKLDISDAEIDDVGKGILELLEEGRLSTQELRKKAPEGLIRSLGAPGKKLGVTSTLPMSLRRLEFAGRIRRIPVEARLDHERYQWVVASVDVGEYEPEDAGELARLYLSWAGPSTRKEFAAWSGFNQTTAKKALASIEETWTADLCGESVVCLGDTALPEIEDSPTWLPAMDNFYGLRSSSALLVDDAHRDVEVRNFGRGPARTLGTMSQPLERTIVVRGEVVGLWGWEPATEQVVCAGTHCAAEESRVFMMIRDLGHARTMSLDKDALLQNCADRIKALQW